MSDQNKPAIKAQGDPSALSNEQLLNMFLRLQESQKEMLATVLSEAKKPYVDEVKEARAKRDRERLRAQREASELERLAREANCNHLRGNGTSVIAWMPFYNGNIYKETVGCCMHCNRMIRQSDPDYVTLAKIPVMTNL